MCVFETGSAEYTADNYHWALSSTTNSTCTVQPATAEDVGKIVSSSGISDPLQGAELTIHDSTVAYPGAHPNTVWRA